jgi:hypothetical protein
MTKSTYPVGSQAWLVGEEAKLEKLVLALEAQWGWLSRNEGSEDYDVNLQKTIETLRRYCAQCDVVTQAGGRV